MRLPALTLTALLALGTALAAPATADVFIPEGEPGTALHLGSDFAPQGRVTGLSNVHGMGVAPKRRLLVAGSLSEIEPGSIAKPDTVSEEDHEAHHGGGTPADGAVSLLTLVDAESYEVTRRIEVPGIVHHVEVSADERLVAVTHPVLGGISIIDLETGEVSATIETGPMPEYAIANPETGNFFVSNAGNDTISVVDPEEGYVIRNIKLSGGPKHMQFLPDERKLVVSLSDAGKVAVIDADSGDMAERYEVGGDLHGVAADDGAIWSSARERDRVVRIDRRSGEKTEVMAGPEPYHMALADGALLVSSADRPELWVLDPETLEKRKAVEIQGIGHQLVELDLK